MTPKCKQTGCNDPRLVSSSGVLQTYCETHQREYWRKKSQERESRKNKSLRSQSFISSVCDNGTTIERTAAAPAPQKPQFNSAEIQALVTMKEGLEAKRELKLKALVTRMIKETVVELVEQALAERLGNQESSAL